MKILSKLMVLSLVLPMLALAAQAELKTQTQKQSYSLGLNVGTQAQRTFQAQSLEVDAASFAKGIEDALANNKPLLGETEVTNNLRNLQQSLVQKQEQQITSRAQTKRSEILALHNFPYIGNKKGDVTIVEFFDYRCPHCQRVAPQLKQLVKEDKKVRVIYREYPILGPTSELAARAALAAKAQGKYNAFHKALMETPNISRDKLFSIAKTLKLNKKKFEQALKDDKSPGASKIRATQKLAHAIGLPYTPGFFIATTPTGNAAVDNKAPFYFVTGEPNLETLKQFIDKVRANTQPNKKS